MIIDHPKTFWFLISICCSIHTLHILNMFIKEYMHANGDYSGSSSRTRSRIGGIFDGRGLGASLCLGAVGVWVGTRFICCQEANAGPVHKQRILQAQSVDTTRTEVFTGRPCRVMKTPYVRSWEGKEPEVQARQVAVP